jgi:hypothetical protein
MRSRERRQPQHGLFLQRQDLCCRRRRWCGQSQNLALGCHSCGLSRRQESRRAWPQHTWRPWRSPRRPDWCSPLPAIATDALVNCGIRCGINQGTSRRGYRLVATADFSCEGLRVRELQDHPPPLPEALLALRSHPGQALSRRFVNHAIPVRLINTLHQKLKLL